MQHWADGGAAAADSRGSSSLSAHTQKNFFLSLFLPLSLHPPLPHPPPTFYLPTSTAPPATCHAPLLDFRPLTSIPSSSSSSSSDSLASWQQHNAGWSIFLLKRRSRFLLPAMRSVDEHQLPQASVAFCYLSIYLFSVRCIHTLKAAQGFKIQTSLLISSLDLQHEICDSQPSLVWEGSFGRHLPLELLPLFPFIKF